MRKFTIVVVLLCSYLFTQAQNRYAIKGGINYSGAKVVFINEVLAIKTNQPSKQKMGYGIGVLADYQLEGPIHFTPTVMYNMRGYTYTPTYGDISKYENTIHYFDINPAFSYHFKTGVKSSFIVFAGPQLGFALMGKEKTTVNGVTTSNNMKFNMEWDYSLVDLGVKGGIGYHGKKFLVDLSYYLGASNINNVVESDHRNIKNRMVSFNIGYFIK